MCMKKGFISNYLSPAETPLIRDDLSKYMTLAINEAKKSDGAVHPNPFVGAVIVKDGLILGIGRHKKCGDLHAEREALKDAALKGNDVSGATIYITLEPCCHTGRQPPCTQAIIDSGIKKVVMGSGDPNALVNGKGVGILRNAGIEVVEGILKTECDALNDIFFSYIQKKIPYVILKYAMTADGKIATSSGRSKWISGDSSRKFVHHLRRNVSAVLTGIGTVLKDDPMLNCRLDDGINHFQPARIICDSNLRIPLESNLVKTAKEISVMILCTEKNFNSEDKKKKIIDLENAGCKIIEVSEDVCGHVDLMEALKILGEMKIDSILVEGGSTLNAGFLFYGKEKKSIANEVITFVGPKIFGGSGNNFSPVSGTGADEVCDGEKLLMKDMSVFDEDVAIEYEVKKEAMYVYGNN